MSGRSLYARGLFELAMVFLGVLAAFMVDGWRQEREERAQEVLYLERLAVDLRQDSSTLDGGWSPGLERKLAAMAAIGPYVRGQTRSVGDTLAFLENVAAAGAGGFTAWVFDTPTFDDLMATGNLRLIENAELRSRVVGHYRRIQIQRDRIVTRISGYPMQVHAFYPSEERDRLTPESIRAFGIERALARVRSEAFVDVLNQEYNTARFQERLIPPMRTSTLETLVAVEGELRRLGAR